MAIDSVEHRRQSSRVFVVAYHGDRDVSDAERFGSLQLFSRPSIVPADAASLIYMMKLRQRLVKFLECFQEDVDFLLPIGDPIISAMATAILSRTGVRRLRMLKYDRQERAYYEIGI